MVNASVVDGRVRGEKGEGRGDRGQGREGRGERGEGRGMKELNTPWLESHPKEAYSQVEL